jgi:hypothetical protein
MRIGLSIGSSFNPVALDEVKFDLEFSLLWKISRSTPLAVLTPLEEGGWILYPCLINLKSFAMFVADYTISDLSRRETDLIIFLVGRHCDCEILLVDAADAFLTDVTEFSCVSHLCWAIIMSIAF